MSLGHLLRLLPSSGSVVLGDGLKCSRMLGTYYVNGTTVQRQLQISFLTLKSQRCHSSAPYLCPDTPNVHSFTKSRNFFKSVPYRTPQIQKVENNSFRCISTLTNAEAEARKELLLQSKMDEIFNVALSNPSVTDDWSQVDNHFKQGSHLVKRWPSILLNYIANLNSSIPQAFEVGLSLAEYVSKSPNSNTIFNLVSRIAICVQHGGPAKHDLAFEYYEKLLSHLSDDILDGTTSALLIKSLCQTSRWVEGRRYIEMAKLTHEVSNRYYDPVIIAACKAGSFDIMNELLKEMYENCLVPSHDVYMCLIEHGLILELLRLFEKYKWIPREETVNAISDHFVSLDASKWTASKSTVLRRILKVATYQKKRGVLAFMWWKRSNWTTARLHFGQCSHCRKNLEPLRDVSGEEFEKLRELFLQKSMLREGNVFMNTSPEEMEGFSQFLKTSGSFDIIIDALNVAFKTHQGASTRQKDLVLSEVLRYFGSRYRVLVLGKKHMIKWKSYQSTLSKPENMKWFLTDNQSADDTFMLYAALHSGQKTKIVTSDELRDHRFLLGTDLAQRFKVWQRGHQVMFLGLWNKNGKSILKLKWPDSHETIVQHTSDSWHIPYDDGTEKTSFEIAKTWYCLQRTPS